jgi:hypothetical protein
MTGQAQTVAPSLLVEIAEPEGRTARFVAADTDRDHTFGAKFTRGSKDGRGRLCSKLTNSVKDPAHVNLAESFRFGVDGVEYRLDALLFPEDDAGRERDFGVGDTLRGQTFEQAACGERVGRGRAQFLRNPDVRLDEAGEVGVGEGVTNFVQRQSRIKLADGLRLYGPFQVQMKLGFRQGTNEAGEGGFAIFHR